MKMITLNEKDYNRLVDAIKQLRLSAVGNSNIKNLAEQLKAATVIPTSTTPANLITMNSVVSLKRMDNNQTIELSLVYHDAADIKAKKISVFAPMGIALLGRKEQQQIHCNLPGGHTTYLVTKLIYQPESAGDNHL